MDKKELIRGRLRALRELMKENNIDAYLIMSDDFHASEYVGAYFHSRAYMSGFDGSAGTLLVLLNEAGLWTDGRYFIQAEEQLKDTGITLWRIGEPGVLKIVDYLKENMQNGQTLAYDGRCVSAAYAKELKEKLLEKQVCFIEDIDLVDSIWADRPALSSEPVYRLEDRFTGKTSEEKLAELRKQMVQEGADYCLLSSLDDIAWLYNIRGNDIAYNPVALAYSLVGKNQATLYLNVDHIQSLGAEIVTKEPSLMPYLQVYEDLKGLESREENETTILLDSRVTNTALLRAIPKGIRQIDKPLYTRTAKAVKNAVEMNNLRNAHLKDGVALTKLIFWLKQQYGTKDYKAGHITELTVCEKLEELRKLGEGYIEQSFAPISAFGAHGAIVHYEPTKETDIPLGDDNFLLLDTGGQYYEGTTDVTRTIALGNVSLKQKQHYTAVLRGNLNLAAAHFKYGCTGTNFDYLARAPLWELGLDYNHGTGHGVGYLLNVHEGPNAFRLKEAGGKIGTVFEEGMLTSDEPGLYFEGEYGIRLENLVLCVKREKTEYGQFMGFDTVTLVPFDRSAILPECMSDRERKLLNAYHEMVYEKIAPFLSEEEEKWLKEETRPL